MNDRYLYRAKRKNWRELPKEMWWVEGYYAFIDNHHYIYTGNLCNGGLYVVAERFEIDIATLCACTGLEDKNGKLIWENDILMCHGNKKDLCKVCFGEFKVIDIENMVAVDVVQGFYYKPLETDELSKCEPFCYEMPLTNYYLKRMDAEVIGNIFDNPELLRK